MVNPIARIVHRIWFGPHQMPEEYVGYQKAWEDLGYEVFTWTEKNLPPLINQETFNNLTMVNTGCDTRPLGVWIQRADIASYELVYRFGGIYANCDIEPLQPLDKLLEGVTAFAGMEQKPWIGNAIFGATREHPFFGAVIHELPHRMAMLPGKAMAHQTGPHLITAVSNSHGGLHVFDQEVFYPYGYLQMDREHDPHPFSYTAHHWGHRKWFPESA